MTQSVIISPSASRLIEDQRSHVFVFGYGSLLWRPNFEYIEQHECYVTNYVRRFHQSSEDHRGTPDYPGRVVTLEPTCDSNDQCRGLVYLIHASQLNDVIGYLNEREIGGYELKTVQAYFDVPRHVDGHSNELVQSVEALVYLATNDNQFYAGAESIDVLANRISRSVGPSGPNSEYLFRLYDWLQERHAVDAHIEQLNSRVKRIINEQNEQRQDE